MIQAILDRTPRVCGSVCVIHRLQQEVVEGEVRELLRQRVVLRIDQLQFVALLDHQFARGLRADADPVDAGGRRDRAVGLDRDLEAAIVQRANEIVVHLQQWLAASQHTQAITRAADPFGRDGVGELIGAAVAATLGAVGSNEVGVAELADRVVAIALAPGPEVAASKAAEHGGAANIGALALQRQEYFFHREARHDAIIQYACARQGA